MRFLQPTRTIVETNRKLGTETDSLFSALVGADRLPEARIVKQQGDILARLLPGAFPALCHVRIYPRRFAPKQARSQAYL
jgi:hypothetical protein